MEWSTRRNITEREYNTLVERVNKLQEGLKQIRCAESAVVRKYVEYVLEEDSRTASCHAFSIFADQINNKEE